MMGFFRACWGLFLGTSFFDSVQQPLQLPIAISPPHVDAIGPTFEVAGTNFTCSYPTLTGYQACNTAADRSCWLQTTSNNGPNYTINTDYDTITPRGVLREYWLEVDLKAIAPDGYLKSLGQVLNGTYPGPEIQACWGDELVIHVTNKIPNLGTTIHWHGIRQLGTNQYDGVNGVTQCPIALNETFTYRFNVTQYGHTWYHSHYQAQYADGVAAPLTVHGPSSSPWDITSEPILITDWVHENSSIVFQQELFGGEAVADNLLLQGKGTFRCAADDPLCCSGCAGNCAAGVDPDFCCTPDPLCFDPVTHVKYTGSTFTKTFVEGKRYLIKLVGASAASMFIFSIDNHELEVIASDFVPIKPYKTDAIFVGIGQRYQVVVTAQPSKIATDGNYWIRTRIADGCGPVSQDSETTGIVRYNASSTATPTTFTHHHHTACQDEPVTSLQPVVSWDVLDLQGELVNFTFVSGISTTLHHGAFRWGVADTPLFVDYSAPTLLHIDNTSLMNDPYRAIVDYPFTGGYAYLVINDSFVPTAKRPFAAAHPIHLHGHDFVVLAQEKSTFNGTLPPLQLNNHPRRDTALLYDGGWLALAFKPDNPGVWLLHCHIAWHASSGMALEILERQSEINSSLAPLTDIAAGCNAWDREGLRFKQDESGV